MSADIRSRAISGLSSKRWLLVAGLLLGFCVGYFATSPNSPTEKPRPAAASLEHFVNLPEAESMPAPPSDLLAPADRFGPKQVVEIQMEALAEYGHDRAAIHQVFAHASDANRAVTGPLEKFEQMILQPPFSALVASKHFMVGQAVEQENVATVLVTTVDGQGRMSVFRFFLSKQSDSNPGCWMTDGVFPLVGNWRPGDALPGIDQKLPESI